MNKKEIQNAIEHHLEMLIYELANYEKSKRLGLRAQDTALENAARHATIYNALHKMSEQ